MKLKKKPGVVQKRHPVNESGVHPDHIWVFTGEWFETKNF